MSVHLRVRDINDNAPNCSSLSHFSVSADDEPTRAFALLNIEDPDEAENGSVTYRLQHEHPVFDVRRSGEA